MNNEPEDDDSLDLTDPLAQDFIRVTAQILARLLAKEQAARLANQEVVVQPDGEANVVVEERIFDGNPTD